MNNDSPLAFFITWTVYGTFLPGDARGWRLRRRGNQLPRPRLAQWHRDRLKFDRILLSKPMREIVNQTIEKHCRVRNWHHWASNARSNHVHAVITAPDHRGSVVRDQLKAYCTRAIRATDSEFVDRPVWTRGGDWECINSTQEVADCVAYVLEAQDQKGRDIRNESSKTLRHF